MSDNAFKILVIALLVLVAAAQGIQAYESVDRMVARATFRAKLPAMDAAAKKAIFESPETKGIWHQIFLQNQVATEYLKDIAQR